jgi:hypothetical protein
MNFNFNTKLVLCPLHGLKAFYPFIAGPGEVNLRIDSSYPDSGPTTADIGAHIIGIAILEFGAILHRCVCHLANAMQIL